VLEKIRSQTDLLLLLAVLLVIVIYPLLDHDGLRRLILAALIFVPVLLATIRLSKKKGWVWPSIVLMLASFIVAAASTVFFIPTLVGMKWGLLTVFFGFTVFGLFSYLKDARSVSNAHLYTAISIYLLLGMQWFALYSAIDVFYPGAILHNNATIADRQSELLYFSLVTLSTIGYGDVVPRHGEVRILAALEGIAGVLYIAITVALLVSAYKQRDTLQEP
jgi:hypothetical protein